MGVEPKQRLLSLDTLRGFDMFWIIGGDQFFRTLADLTHWKWADWWGGQLEHVPWAGFHAYDLIFPLFMFVCGVAIPYALTAKLEQRVPKTRLVLKVIRRAALLVFLGMVCNGLLKLDFANQRVASVLGQIGIAYLIAALIVLNCRTFKAQLLWCLGILSGYAAVQLLIPVPGHGAGVLTPEGCINGYIDRMLLPGRFYGGIFDPEGLLCMVSASGITLMGALAGSVLRADRFGGYRKTAILAGCGIALTLMGGILGQWYPIIKAAWTTTFNLLTGGISLLLLALFYLVIDVWKARRWAFFFRVIGLNSITIYIGVRMINFGATSDFLFGGVAPLCGAFSPLVMIAGTLCVEWLFLWFLYRKNVFLRL